MVVGLITGLNISVKSCPNFWWNPLVTNLAFRQMILPCLSCLMVKTHLHPITCMDFLSETNIYVLLAIIFIFHSSFPFRILKSLKSTWWHKLPRSNFVKWSLGFRVKWTILWLRYHWVGICWRWRRRLWGRYDLQDVFDRVLCKGVIKGTE